MPRRVEITFGIIGVGLLAVSTFLVIRGYAIRDTQSVPGIVLTSGVHQAEGEIFFPEVEFQYVVQGKQYRATWNGRLNHSSDRRMARWTAGRFAPGGHCIAYYRPEAPHDAWLEKRPTFLEIFMTIVAGLGGIVFLSVSITCYVWRRAKQSSRQMAVSPCSELDDHVLKL